MASGRILKSQISLSEQVNDVSLHAALLFTWMIPHADDFGRMRGGNRKVKAQVVPMRDDFSAAKVDACLKELDKAKLIQLYEVEGDFYIQFPTWEEHQQGLHKRTKSKLPDPPQKNLPGNSGKFRAELEQNRTEQEEEQNRTEGAEAPPEKPAEKKLSVEEKILSDFGITGQLAADFIVHRKSCGTKKEGAPITVTAMEGFVAESQKAGISVEDAVRISIDRGWRGFNSGWNWQPKATTPQQGRTSPQYIPREQRGQAANVIDSTARRV